MTGLTETPRATPPAVAAAWDAAVLERLKLLDPLQEGLQELSLHVAPPQEALKAVKRPGREEAVIAPARDAPAPRREHMYMHLHLYMYMHLYLYMYMHLHRAESTGQVMH